ncbi:CaiB/BaiF CoA transferase family protein [Hydrocarboniclastica marina]|uniref:CoA transferase n=1 Tax=Hydrocarboniclastica marina TaxID=2259620 RepID=A0A4P7XKG6_9ALTE|nr:CaiB/BaiF CoA-transferase family protein [Hydrocarboniclastica marina]MAM00561.1 carnitine dehydratase [Alteromonadaceae bacterium]QCF26427.1 CoA transferase [Hydrocarboniclastica marina]
MSGPLQHIRILDFTTLLPGPYATMMLADMGADVLRVESPSRLDLVRVMPPHDRGVATAHSYLNRGKRSLALDLKQQECVETVKALVRDYDVVVEQFRPGVMDRLGVGYATLREINPRLIYCAITGYGQTGPYRLRAGHDINYLALAGVASYSGRAEGGPPPLGIQVADVAGGSHHAVMGILAAIIHRQQSGEGQFVDVSMTDAAFSLNAMAGAAALGADHQPGPESDVLNGGSFYDYYRTADNRWLAVGSLEPQFMQELCKTLGCPELASKGLSPKPEHQQQLKQTLRERFAEQPLEHWQHVFADREACVEPVLTLREASEHPQLTSRDMVIEVDRGDGEKQRQLGHPIKFSETPCQSRFAGRVLGADNESVLQELEEHKSK